MPFAAVNKNVTLQVRKSASRLFQINNDRLEKASAFASGSITVEAALSLSLFCFASICLIMPVKMVNTARQIQAGLESACEDLCRYACLLEVTDEFFSNDAQDGKLDELMGEDQEISGGVTGILGQAGGILYAHGQVMKQIDSNAVEGFSLLASEILKDGETIDLKASYRLSLPFSVFGLSSIPMSARSRRRAWVGESGIMEYEEGQTPEEDTIMVYVGKSRGRYHWLRNCHYLYNDIKAVSFAQIEDYRNSSGSRYRACRVCKSDMTVGGIVYLMPSGESYHGRKDCLSIVSYVEKVPLSEVEYLGACSYCSKRRGEGM